MSAAAGVFLGEFDQSALQERVNGCTDTRCARAVKDIDADLVETHERTHAHAAGNELVDAVARQVIDRGHAAALLVRHVGQGADRRHDAVFHVDDGVEVTMPEMSADLRFQPPGTVEGTAILAFSILSPYLRIIYSKALGWSTDRKSVV